MYINRLNFRMEMKFTYHDKRQNMHMCFKILFESIGFHFHQFTTYALCLVLIYLVVSCTGAQLVLFLNCFSLGSASAKGKIFFFFVP